MELYIRLMVKWWLVCVFIVASYFSKAQSGPLSASSQRWVHKVDSLLQLSSYQKEQVIFVWKNYEDKINALEIAKQKLAQNNSLSPEQWELQESEISAQKKEYKKFREEQLDALWDERQRIIYQELIAPSKSPVGHMGVKHDRANCNICVRP